jgi:hypothetical protein
VNAPAIEFMKTVSKNVDGQYYPEFHFGWGGCAEELFHYTSRYALYTEAFLRNLADQRQFSLMGYSPANMGEKQRRLMAAILSVAPDRDSARALTAIVRSVRNGDSAVDATLAERYRERLKVIPEGVTLVYAERSPHIDRDNVAPLDPFLNLAKRLMLPVAVHDHHIEVSLKQLAEHLDSSNATLRSNLQEAILRVHNAGYILRNHPGLTHKTAKDIGDEESV